MYPKMGVWTTVNLLPYLRDVEFPIYPLLRAGERQIETLHFLSTKHGHKSTWTYLI
jgi:hypothetical protein